MSGGAAPSVSAQQHATTSTLSAEGLLTEYPTATQLGPAGEWLCRVCGNINYSFRCVCHLALCGAPRGFPGPYKKPPTLLPQPTTSPWHCPVCDNYNRATRMQCHRPGCAVQRVFLPDGTETYVPGKKERPRGGGALHVQQHSHYYSPQQYPPSPARGGGEGQPMPYQQSQIASLASSAGNPPPLPSSPSPIACTHKAPSSGQGLDAVEGSRYHPPQRQRGRPVPIGAEPSTTSATGILPQPPPQGFVASSAQGQSLQHYQQHVQHPQYHYVPQQPSPHVVVQPTAALLPGPPGQVHPFPSSAGAINLGPGGFYAPFPTTTASPTASPSTSSSSPASGTPQTPSANPYPHISYVVLAAPHPSPPQ